MNLTALHGAVAEAWMTQDPANAGDPQQRHAVLELERVGFAGASETPATPDECRLLRLLQQCDLTLQFGKGLDGEIDVAFITWDPQEDAARRSGGDVFVGVDLSPRGAIRRCLGEFAEFASWLFRPGDAKRRCRAEALPGPAIDPWHALGFSARQIAERERLNAEWIGCDSIPLPDAFAGEIDWAPARRQRDGAAVWAPAQICFGRYGRSVSGAAAAWGSDTNGCAAGPSPSAARLRALYELIERDATGLWWYARQHRPALDWRRLDDSGIAARMAARDAAGETWFLDLTTEFAVPVVAALATDRAGRLSGLGFGCDVSPAKAAARAFRELCQTELGIALVRQRLRSGGDGPAAAPDRALLQWLAQASAERLPHLRPGPVPAPQNRAGAIPEGGDEALYQELAGRLMAHGIDLYEIDLTRPEIGIAVSRLLAPGLCHYKPRLGCRRLLGLNRELLSEPLRL